MYWHSFENFLFSDAISYWNSNGVKDQRMKPLHQIEGDLLLGWSTKIPQKRLYKQEEQNFGVIGCQ